MSTIDLQALIPNNVQLVKTASCNARWSTGSPRS